MSTESIKTEPVTAQTSPPPTQADTNSSAKTESTPSDNSTVKTEDDVPVPTQSSSNTTVPQSPNTSSNVTPDNNTDNTQYDPKTVQQVQKQIEFYFSNSNLPKDKYLKQIYDTNNNYVDISILMSFKRMQQLTSDISLVQHAIQQSKQLQLNSDKTAVTRTTPLPTSISTNKQTIHVSNLASDATIDSVTDYFNTVTNCTDAVNAVRLHYVRNRNDSVKPETDNTDNTNQKQFDGTAFVEFKTVDLAQYCASKTDLQYGDNILQVVMKNVFFNQQIDNDRKRKHEDTEPVESVNDSHPTDKLIKFTGLSSESSRESVKQYVQDVNSEISIAYIDYQRGEADAIVRLNDDDTIGAKSIVEKLHSNAKELDGNKVNVSLVEGEEEKELWKKIRSKQVERKQNSNKNKRQRERGGGRDRETTRQRR